MGIKEQVFVPCARHRVRDGIFIYSCHACLVSTVGRLCELLDEKEREKDGS